MTAPVLLLLPAALAGVHHDLDVRLDVPGHRVEVVDRVSLDADVVPDADGGWRFLLHAGMEPRVETRGWRLERVPGEPADDFFGIDARSGALPADVPLEGWRLVPRGRRARFPVEIRYGGVVHHPIRQSGEEYQRSFEETPGIVEDRGVFLSGASGWVPTFGDALLTFEMRVDGLPEGWTAVSQGRRGEPKDGIVRYEMPHRTEEIYLVAGPWRVWEDRADGAAGPVELRAFLRSDDPGLAQRYLQATRRHLRVYESFLPPYPYSGFALVENFWETGYGMPGFTLLGPEVIRFPWILTSSYPHELLHNWWGNSAYVDPAGGNWCEGLTAYLADHLFAENRGEGARYRRDTLKRYTDFVADGDDFPLVEFGSRTSAASEAVGYGKALMVFHMARHAVTDEVFRRALARFYESARFRRATWADFAAALDAETGEDWGPFFEAWTTRPGAPRLELAGAEVAGDGPWTLRVRLRQGQEDDPFPVIVPVAVTVEGEPEARVLQVAMTGREAVLEAELDRRPLRVDVDPAFDVMRRLDPLELPPTLSTVMGADDVTFVLPADAPEDELAAWTALAGRWAAPARPRIVRDADLDGLPEGPTWVLGWSNRLAPAVADLLPEVGIDAGGARIAGQHVPRGSGSAVAVARSPADPAAAVGWVAGPVAAIPGLARKLPHYTRYSYLAFEGDAPDNVLKGAWEPEGSPLVRALGDGPLPPLRLPERAPLAELPPLFEADRLLDLAARLAAPEMEGRAPGSAGLERATALVEERMRAAGLEPAGDDGGFRQVFRGRGPDGEVELVNLVGRVPGRDPGAPPVLLLAHLDHLGRGWPDARAGRAGELHPGADDNASGVSVLLAVAASLAADPPHRRDVLVAVTSGEESGLQGARHLLGALERKPAACVNLDTVGRLGDGEVLVLDASSATEWPHVFMGVGYVTGVPVAVARERLDSSDQAACLEAGVPGVQLFTGAHPEYHSPEDTADRLDAEGMARVAEVAREAVVYLADRAEPLSSTLGAGGAAAARRGGEGRRVSLGTVPDFAYPGPGVRVQDVVAGSPAEAAGIRPGDVLVEVAGEPVADLRAFSRVLKAHEPGDEVTVVVERGGERVELRATLAPR